MNDTKPLPAQDVGSGALFGVLQRAGTFPVRDEETTGFVVACTPEELRNVERLPMYRRVVILTADQWNEKIAERDHLVGALCSIQRLWSTQSEACADNSRVAYAMAETARTALAYLDSPNSKDEPRGGL